MALWQYTFQIIPNESFNIFQKDVDFFSDDELFDDEPYWKHKPINKLYFEGINTTLQKGKSWSESIELYGNQESNCFEVLFDTQTNNVISVSFRIDFTSDFEQVLQGIIEFCIFKGLIILDENLQVVPLNFESARGIIENAPQVRRLNELKNKSMI